MSSVLLSLSLSMSVKNLGFTLNVYYNIQFIVIHIILFLITVRLQNNNNNNNNGYFKCYFSGELIALT